MRAHTSLDKFLSRTDPYQTKRNQNVECIVTVITTAVIHFRWHYIQCFGLTSFLLLLSSSCWNWKLCSLRCMHLDPITNWNHIKQFFFLLVRYDIPKHVTSSTKTERIKRFWILIRGLSNFLNNRCYEIMIHLYRLMSCRYYFFRIRSA